MTVPVGPGSRVRLRFRLQINDGELVDETPDEGATFVYGDGNLPGPFERRLTGMVVNEQRCFEVASDDAFGPRIEENVQRIDRSRFPADIGLEAGLVVSFADAQDAELPGGVIGLDEKTATVDFNHPLSGKDLLFDVTILDVEQVSNEIARSR